jgi:hypothetical protein
MPKFYVKSGQLKFIIDTIDFTSAILAGLKHSDNKHLILGSKICISETGFEDYKKWTCYDINKFLKKK